MSEGSSRVYTAPTLLAQPEAGSRLSTLERGEPDDRARTRTGAGALRDTLYIVDGDPDGTEQTPPRGGGRASSFSCLFSFVCVRYTLQDLLHTQTIKITDAVPAAPYSTCDLS